MAVKQYLKEYEKALCEIEDITEFILNSYFSVKKQDPKIGNESAQKLEDLIKKRMKESTPKLTDIQQPPEGLTQEQLDEQYCGIPAGFFPALFKKTSSFRVFYDAIMNHSGFPNSLNMRLPDPSKFLPVPDAIDEVLTAVGLLGKYKKEKFNSINLAELLHEHMTYKTIRPEFLKNKPYV